MLSWFGRPLGAHFGPFSASFLGSNWLRTRFSTVYKWRSYSKWPKATRTCKYWVEMHMRCKRVASRWLQKSASGACNGVLFRCFFRLSSPYAVRDDFCAQFLLKLSIFGPQVGPQNRQKRVRDLWALTFFSLLPCLRCLWGTPWLYLASFGTCFGPYLASPGSYLGPEVQLTWLYLASTVWYQFFPSSFGHTHMHTRTLIQTTSVLTPSAMHTFTHAPCAAYCLCNHDTYLRRCC